MYAVIETGGKQYRVAPGATLKIEKLTGEHGAAIKFDKVLAVVSDLGVITSGKAAAGATVSATIQSHGREDKVLVFKFKRKKQYKKTIGHRQGYTEIRVDSIEG